jgi:hypothetical protein
VPLIRPVPTGITAPEEFRNSADKGGGKKAEGNCDVAVALGTPAGEYQITNTPGCGAPWRS